MRQHANPLIAAMPPKPVEMGYAEDALRLDRGESAYPPSPATLQAMMASLSKANRYPLILSKPLLEALAGYANVAPAQIALGNGSDDLIENVIKAFSAPGDRIVAPLPTFPWYAMCTRLHGREFVAMPRDARFECNTEGLLAAASDATIVFLANPNNPTGNTTPREQLQRFIERTTALVVVDECYYEFCGESVADLTATHDNLIVLRTFSKGFALAGLRIGYAIANSENANAMRRAAQLFAVNAVAQAGALAALADLDYYRARIAETIAEREALATSVSGLGLHVYPSKTNFLLVSAKSLGIEAASIGKALMASGVFVQDCVRFPGVDTHCFRLSVCDTSDRQRLLIAMDDALSQCAPKTAQPSRQSQSLAALTA
jgi:histidinol-phosphate aminotransferase